MNPISLSMGEDFNKILADTSQSCRSFPFLACSVMWYPMKDKYPSPSWSSHSWFAPQQKQYLYLAEMGWWSLKSLTSMWKTLLSKAFKTDKETTVLCVRKEGRWTLAWQYGSGKGVCFPSSDLICRFHPLQPVRYFSKAWQEPALMWSSYCFLLQAISL